MTANDENRHPLAKRTLCWWYKLFARCKTSACTGGGEAFDGIGLNIKPEQISNSYDTQAFIFDIATKQVEPITKNFYPSISSYTWSKNDNIIYFRAEDKDRLLVFSYNPKNKQYKKLPLQEELIGSFSLAKSSNMAAYVVCTNSRRAFRWIKKNELNTLADPYGERLDKLTLGEVKDWLSAKQAIPFGRYYLPPL